MKLNETHLEVVVVVVGSQVQYLGALFEALDKQVTSWRRKLIYLPELPQLPRTNLEKSDRPNGHLQARRDWEPPK
jgi:hypothetical protein